MLQDLAITAVPHLPYLAAIVLGGIAGNAIADRKVNLPASAYAVLAFIFVGSLCAQCYCLEHGMRALLLLANAISGASLAFTLTVGGDFAASNSSISTRGMEE